MENYVQDEYTSAMQSCYDDGMEGNRPLTSEEYELVRWMLENGEPEAARFLPQLEIAEVTPKRCPCGCASIEFQLKGHPLPPPGVHPISDFVFGEEGNLSGVFVFEKDGVLAGIEVYGLAGSAPTSLPSARELRPW
ncbi:MAG: hypothetical protein KF708_20210 [Pirellulales bacterium]|nr:hypothetical protein [Pirellulales bacterium]